MSEHHDDCKSDEAPKTYREQGSVLPDKPTEDDWRLKDALDTFQHYLSHEQVGPRLPTDLRQLLSFAFRCGWSAKENHRRRFVNHIDELLTESKFEVHIELESP